MSNTNKDVNAPVQGQQTDLVYTPVVYHWFYKKLTVGKYVWMPFSYHDSETLENSFKNNNLKELVPVEGGRYDVNIKERSMVAVYWIAPAIEVRRCSWFFKGAESKFVPYEEAIADMLEREYMQAVTNNTWQLKIQISEDEQVIFQSADIMFHFGKTHLPWEKLSSSIFPRNVKRDLSVFDIQDGENRTADYLLFMVPGIGKYCDLKMHTVDEAVDIFRNITHRMINRHYKNAKSKLLISTIEVLPIFWHDKLREEENGIDARIKLISLDSVPKMRYFANDALLDILLYTSPIYCQRIMDSVANSLNVLYDTYCKRNPNFKGNVSLIGLSLGSVVVFDLLCNQNTTGKSEVDSIASGQQQQIIYKQLQFKPKHFFAIGSPISVFITIRGISSLGVDFQLPTCPAFFNIFHPYDPIAYRIETLIDANMYGIRPIMIAHHQGRKRLHLEFKDTMARLGTDIMQCYNTLRSAFAGVSFLSPRSKSNLDYEDNNQVANEASQQSQQNTEEYDVESELSKSIDSNAFETVMTDGAETQINMALGKLNQSKRIDYVLQEAPLESVNEYLFAISSHLSYWTSLDTSLFIINQIYDGMGISADNKLQVPTQTQSQTTIQKYSK